MKLDYIIKLLVIGCLLLVVDHKVNAYEMDDTIEVYYLIAPLMSSKYGYLLANFNAFHAGLGFVASRTNEQFTVDFIAVPTIMDSFFPKLVNNSGSSSSNPPTSGTSGSVASGSLSGATSGVPTPSSSSQEPTSSDQVDIDLIWNTAGIVQYKELINNTYWTSRELIFKITGEQFKEYLCWIPQYNVSYPFYNLFDVSDPYETYIASNTCYDFVWSSFSTLYSLGGNLIATTPPKRDFVTLNVVTNPAIIYHPREYNNWKEITEFYSKFIWKPDEPITDFISNLTTLLNGTFFLHVNEQYYNLTITPTNPLTISYSPQNLPWGTPDPIAIGVNPQCVDNKKKSKFIGGGWVFIIVLFSIATVYILGGVLVNKFAFHKHGKELLPNPTFWTGFAHLIADGGRWIKSKLFNSTPTPNREYQPLL